MPSIHSTITKYILTGLFLVALMTGVIIDKFTRQQFNSEFNKTLQTKAWTLATLTEQDNDKVDFDFADEMMPEFIRPDNPEYFQLWLGNGELLEKSHSLAGKELPFLKINLGDTHFQDVVLPDGNPGRLVAIRFTPQLDDEEDDDERTDQHSDVLARTDSDPLETVTLVIAKNRSELIHNLMVNRVVIFIAFISMLLMSYLIILLATRKGLSPLTELSTQVQKVDDQSLDTKIQPYEMYSELTTITTQLNYLFSRLNAAFKREKRFSSNVSHELRTPIAELLALSDVARSCVDDPEMSRQFYDDVKDVAQNMNKIVETMLNLAQSDLGAVEKELTVFNLHDCIQTAIKRAEISNKNKLEIEWDPSASNSIQIYSDWGKLTQILTNIISNAFKYGRSESIISITPAVQGQFLSLSISNYSTDLETEDLERLTESFWRKDEARTGGENTGLGLALVDMLCQVLNINLVFTLTEGRLFTVTLSNISAHQ